MFSHRIGCTVRISLILTAVIILLLAALLAYFIAFLGKVGITKDQVDQFKNQLLTQAQSAFPGLLPFLTGLFANIFNLIIVITLSVYFVLDGARIIRWLSLKTPIPQRDTITFLLHIQ